MNSRHHGPVGRLSYLSPHSEQLVLGQTEESTEDGEIRLFVRSKSTVKKETLKCLAPEITKDQAALRARVGTCGGALKGEAVTQPPKQPNDKASTAIHQHSMLRRRVPTS